MPKTKNGYRPTKQEIFNCVSFKQLEIIERESTERPFEDVMRDAVLEAKAEMISKGWNVEKTEESWFDEDEFKVLCPDYEPLNICNQYFLIKKDGK